MHQGGAERIVLNLIQELEETDYKVYLLLLEEVGFYLELLPDYVEIIDLKTPRIRHSIFKIAQTINRIKPQLVFSGFGEVNAFLSPLIRFFPKTRFIARETNVVSEHVKRKEIQFFYRFYNAFNAIVAQSRDMKNDLVENWKIEERKVHLIHNPVNMSFISERKNAFFPSEFNSADKKVVAIGNISYRKGFDNLLEVFGHLRERPIELFIIGEGPEKVQFEKWKNEKELSKVHFLGSRRNPYPYMKNADLFVLSSRYEGFPNVLLEAGACGTFSLANNCKGGIDEIIIPEVNGEISPIENHSQFAEIIANLVIQRFDNERIIESIKSRFNQKKIFSSYIELFNQLCHST